MLSRLILSTSEFSLTVFIADRRLFWLFHIFFGLQRLFLVTLSEDLPSDLGRVLHLFHFLAGGVSIVEVEELFYLCLHMRLLCQDHWLLNLVYDGIVQELVIYYFIGEVNFLVVLLWIGYLINLVQTDVLLLSYHCGTFSVEGFIILTVWSQSILMLVVIIIIVQESFYGLRFQVDLLPQIVINLQGFL